MKVPVVILNYNSSTDCRQCILDLKKQQGVSLEIIVVDNHSSQHEVQAVQEMAEEYDCTFIAADQNRGYNAGNNIGLRYAAEKGYTYALIANPDMLFPQPDYILRLVRAAEQDNDVVVVGSDIVSCEGEHQNPQREMFYQEELWWGWTAWRNRHKKEWLVGDYRQSGYCEKVSGCCLLIKLAFLKTINFFDERVFLYCEEAILSKQVSHMNKLLYYENEAQAIHNHVKSKKGNVKDRIERLFASRYYFLMQYSGYKGLKLWILLLSKKVQCLIYKMYL